LDLEEIAAASARPADVIGMHFSVPADTTRLLENARATQSGPEACATVMKVGKLLGKASVLVAARPGLVADRLRARVALEAGRLLEAGASAAQIDRVLREFGIPTGWDSGAGHEASDEAREVDGFEGALARALAGGDRERDEALRPVPDQEVLERCVYSLVNEGARLLDEKVVTRPVEIDMICVHGLRFPPYRGGPLFYADELGPAVVHEAVTRYRAAVDAASWTPAPLLERLATAGGKFYGANGGEPR
jgi:3-hydroxyacyl-CoA dehydrogenase